MVEATAKILLPPLLLLLCRCFARPEAAAALAVMEDSVARITDDSTRGTLSLVSAVPAAAAAAASVRASRTTGQPRRLQQQRWPLASATLCVDWC